MSPDQKNKFGFLRAFSALEKPYTEKGYIFGTLRISGIMPFLNFSINLFIKLISQQKEGRYGKHRYIQLIPSILLYLHESEKRVSKPIFTIYTRPVSFFLQFNRDSLKKILTH